MSSGKKQCSQYCYCYLLHLIRVFFWVVFYEYEEGVIEFKFLVPFKISDTPF